MQMKYTKILFVFRIESSHDRVSREVRGSENRERARETKKELKR